MDEARIGDALTKKALTAYSRIENARHRELVEGLIRHLHAYVKEVGLREKSAPLPRRYEITRRPTGFGEEIDLGRRAPLQLATASLPIEWPRQAAEAGQQVSGRIANDGSHAP